MIHNNNNNNQLYICEYCGIGLTNNETNDHLIAHISSNEENNNHDEFGDEEILNNDGICISRNISTNYLSQEIINESYYNDGESSIVYNSFYSQKIINNNIVSEIINNLKVNKLYKFTKKFEGEKCIICLNSYEIGNFYVNLPCKHFFHEDCIKLWIIEKTRCPICNYELNVHN